MADQTLSFIVEARQYLAVLHKRRALVISCFAVCMLVATLYNYTTRPVYQATAQILIDRRALSALASQDRMDMAEVTDLATQLQMLRGRSLAEAVVEKLGLHKTTEFQTGPLMSPWERIRRKFPGGTPGPVVDSAGLPLSPAAAAFRSRLAIDLVPGSRLVNVRFRAYDPKIAMDAVNGLAQAYIEQSLDLRSSATSAASGWLGDRIRDQQEKVKAAERALQQYRERTGMTAPDDQGDLASQKLSSLNAAVVTARMERLQKEAQAAQARGTPPSQLDNLPFLLANPAVQSLRAKLSEAERERARLSETLGDKHPDMQRARREVADLEAKLSFEMQGAIQALDGQAQAARLQEASLLSSLEAAKREALNANRKNVEYDLLRREAQNNQELLQDLMSKAGTAGLETELRTTNVRLVERAEYPRAPFSPDRRRNYVVGALLGMALGVGLTLLFEYVDNTVKTPDEIKHDLGLPFMGMVPLVESPTGGARRLMGDNPQSAVAEAYRLLRTNLLFSSPDGSGMVVAVSSANPSEGKTTTVANLAVSLAQNGARVLAIDADLRRPTLHQQFAVHKSPGLSDLIVGKCQASDAVQVTRYKGLHLLPCGYIPPNPAELLGAPSMRAVLAALKTQYDWVLVDTPPILAMADTAVICPFTDGLLLVVTAEGTGKPSIQRSVDQVRSVGGKLIGVLLNKVNLERNSYYYGQYYGEYYRSYYSETESASKRQELAPAKREKKVKNIRRA